MAFLRCATFKALGLVCAPLMLNACGYNSGFLHDASSGDQHQYRMEISAVRYDRTVSARAGLVSILCAIPLDHGLYKQAMDALMSEAKLKENEILENVRTDSDPACYLIFGESSLTISADVYDVIPTTARASGTGSYGLLETGTAAASPPPHPKPAPGDYSQCNVAFDHVDQLAQLWVEWFRPTGASGSTWDRGAFNTICGSLDDDTQLCLDAAFARAHKATCTERLKAISAPARQQLDRLLLRAPQPALITP